MKFKVKSCVVMTALMMFLGSAVAETKAPRQDVKADNTQVNKRDEHGNTTTPMDQSNEAGDLRVLAEVRKAVVDDDTLSIMAHNVKIVTANGVVTLRGPVENAKEKSRVADIAMRVAGVSKVNNELDVK